MERAVAARRSTVIVVLELDGNADERLTFLIGHGSYQVALLRLNALALIPLGHEAERSTQQYQHERKRNEPSFSLFSLHINILACVISDISQQ